MKKKSQKRPPLNPKVGKHYKSFKLEPNTVHIFTDGSCWLGDKSGGWGVVLIYNDKIKELYGGRPNSTNNQMEMTAILEGLKALKSREKHKIIVYSDSQYSINAVSMWHRGWRQNGWITSQGKPVKNRDLIEEITSLVTGFVAFRWVKGHVGIKYNERADELASLGRREYGQQGSKK